MTTNVTKLNEKTAYEKLPTTNTVKHWYVRTSTYCRWSILKAKGGFYFADVCNNTWKLFWSNEYQSICLVVYVPCILSPIRCHVIKISKQSKEEVLLKFPITNPLKKTLGLYPQNKYWRNRPLLQKKEFWIREERTEETTLASRVSDHLQMELLEVARSVKGGRWSRQTLLETICHRRKWVSHYWDR